MADPSIAQIQASVCRHFRIPLIEMRSSRRPREVARPRQIAMFLSRELTANSLPMIGRQFGGRDHTTVIHAIRKVTQLYVGDREFRGHVRELRREIRKAANG